MVVDQKTDSLLGTAIILAAGASVRFGSDKKFTPFAKTTLLHHTVGLYSSVFRKVLLVLKEQTKNNVGSFPENVEIVLAHKARFGVSQSLKAGVIQAKMDPWIVVGLMDMPYVKVRTLESLRERMESTIASVVRPRFNKQYGNPVGFKQDCYPELCDLTGDQGARTLFRAGKFDIEVLEVDDRGILFDIDTPDQLQQYEQLLH